jgi:hypothetical protein
MILGLGATALAGAGCVTQARGGEPGDKSIAAREEAKDIAAREEAKGIAAREEAKGTLYKVGPARHYKDLGQVADLLRPGDIVEVDGDATYGSVLLSKDGTERSKITIRGVRVNGKRPKLSGGRDTVELQGDHTVFEGFEVTGGSSRCIFHHAHDITLRDSVIHDCPAHGVLGADTDSGSLLMEYVEVYACGAGTTKHPVYIATDERAYPGSVFRIKQFYMNEVM